MNKLTFKEQSDKIVGAYLKCEIDPLDPCACFIGNLLNNTSNWIWGRGRPGKISGSERQIQEAANSITKESGGLYTLQEIVALEYNFLKIATADYVNNWESKDYPASNEDDLFKAMTSTLKMLKQIHIAKGEIIEEEITLRKRELV